jgi:NADH-quinone oxidoreductase subunit N
MIPTFPPEMAPNLWPVLPELTLAVGALALVLLGALKGEKVARLVNMLAIALLVLVAVFVLAQGTLRVTVFGRAFVVDEFARFMKLLTLTGSVAAMLLSLDYMKREKLEQYEYGILVVLATLGMMMMISANDLIALYLGIELQSLALYVVAALNRDNAKSSEAGLKYFVLGALSSGMLLYGASFVYGFTGSVSYEEIAKAAQGPQGLGVIFGLVFVMAGLAFKISAVPFHMWTPDVYEGAPSPVTAFFAGAPKMAAMAMTVRILVEAFPGITPQWQQIVSFIAICSMLLGGFAAIGQSNIKRLMAYSSIGNMGYGLVGVAAGSLSGVEGVLIYLAIYLAMTLGVFACVLAMRTPAGRPETIEDLAGLSRTNPGMALILAALLFSLIGIPPLAGFWGKFYVFTAAVNAKLFVLAVIGVLASVVSAFYYLRIIKIMYLDQPATAFVPMADGVKFVLGLSGAFILLVGLMPGPLYAAAAAAAKSLF